MTPLKQLQDFSQSVYLAMKGRYLDDITDEDGVSWVARVVDWTNQFIDELETTVGPSGRLVDWWFARENGATLGTALTGASSIELDNIDDRILTGENRYVQIQQGGITVSNWAVVDAADITNKSDRVVEDMCAAVGTSLVFSRVFKSTENNGTIVGDIVASLPRLAVTPAANSDLFAVVRPKQLLILGVAKNATLPDIVQGGLSPSYVQKFNDLMQGAIARSVASSTASKVARDNLANIRGVY